MSYREGPSYTLVVCDVCQRMGAVGDRTWQAMRVDQAGQELHVCRLCRKTAVWCATHDTYHDPVAQHRAACVTCGGLFTSVVQLERRHCPSCYRALMADAAPASVPRSGAGRWPLWRMLQRLWQTRHSGAGMPRR